MESLSAKRSKKQSRPPAAAKSPASLTARVATWLSRRASAGTWRDVLAFATGFLTVVTMSGGLVYWAPWLQVGVVAGIATGLVGSSVRRATVVAVAAALLGIVAGPASPWQAPPDAVARLWQGGLVAVAAGGVAAAVRFLAARQNRLPRALTWVALLLVVGNLWATALTVNSFAIVDSATGRQVPSLNEQIKGSVPSVIADSDNVFYFNVYRSMRGGEDYYAAFDRLYRAWLGRPASSVLNVRLPALYYVWVGLPGPEWVVYLFLALASGAALCVVPLASGSVKLPFAIPAAAAVSAYFLVFATQFVVFSQEPWAGALAVMGVAALALSWRSDRWIGWAIAGAGALAAATLLRETLAPLMLAGLVSAVWPRAERRAARLAVWAAATAALGIVYGVHWLRARAVVDASSTAGRFGAGGVAFMMSSLEFATNHLGAGGWLPWALAALGLAGAAMLPRPAMRITVLGGVAVILASFLFVGNSATASVDGAVVNYWGAAFLPLLYACMPFSFSLVPGASSSRDPGVRRTAGGR